MDCKEKYILHEQKRHVYDTEVKHLKQDFYDTWFIVNTIFFNQYNRDYYESFDEKREFTSGAGP